MDINITCGCGCYESQIVKKLGIEYKFRYREKAQEKTYSKCADNASLRNAQGNKVVLGSSRI